MIFCVKWNPKYLGDHRHLQKGGRQRMDRVKEILEPSLMEKPLIIEKINVSVVAKNIKYQQHVNVGI